MPYKTESWGKRGKVSVSRDARGRFVSWKRMFNPFQYDEGGKRVAMYGNCKSREGSSTRRYEFSGNGSDLYQAVAMAMKLVPKKRFVTVPAEEFVDDPYSYGTEGFWTRGRPEIES